MLGQDVTTIVFEISGNGSDNFNDARFHYETALGAELQVSRLTFNCNIVDLRKLTKLQIYYYKVTSHDLFQ